MKPNIVNSSSRWLHDCYVIHTHIHMDEHTNECADEHSFIYSYRHSYIWMYLWTDICSCECLFEGMNICMFAAMNIQMNNHTYHHSYWSYNHLESILKQLKLNIIQLHTFARTKHLHSFVWEYIRFAGKTWVSSIVPSRLRRHQIVFRCPTISNDDYTWHPNQRLPSIHFLL